MPYRLGEVVEQGCYKNDQRMSGAKYIHNCTSAGGNEVRWKFEVLDDDGELQGHVIAALSCSFSGDETAQKKRIREIAEEQLPD